MTSYFGSSDLGLLMPEASMLNNQLMLGNLISFKVNAIIDETGVPPNSSTSLQTAL